MTAVGDALASKLCGEPGKVEFGCFVPQRWYDNPDNLVAPRNVRNSNPLNIERAANRWRGKDYDHQGRFERFYDPVDGFRAGFILMQNHIEGRSTAAQRVINEGGDPSTVRGLISIWSPPHENDTDRYAEFVCQQVFGDSNLNRRLDGHAPYMMDFATTMAEKEGIRGLRWPRSTVVKGAHAGGIIVDDDELDKATRRPPKPIGRSRTLATATVVGGAAGIQQASALLPKFSDAFAGLDTGVAYAVIAGIVFLGLAYVGYLYVSDHKKHRQTLDAVF